MSLVDMHIKQLNYNNILKLVIFKILKHITYFELLNIHCDFLLIIIESKL